MTFKFFKTIRSYQRGGRQESFSQMTDKTLANRIKKNSHIYTKHNIEIFKKRW